MGIRVGSCIEEEDEESVVVVAVTTKVSVTSVEGVVFAVAADDRTVVARVDLLLFFTEVVVEVAVTVVVGVAVVAAFDLTTFVFVFVTCFFDDGFETVDVEVTVTTAEEDDDEDDKEEDKEEEEAEEAEEAEEEAKLPGAVLVVTSVDVETGTDELDDGAGNPKSKALSNTLGFSCPSIQSIISSRRDFPWA